MISTPTFKNPVPMPTVLMYHGKEVLNGEAHLLDRSGLAVDWSFANRPITATEMHEPSCKCQYCGCTNDHIYGTCDYCGAPLEG